MSLKVILLKLNLNVAFTNMEPRKNLFLSLRIVKYPKFSPNVHFS